jgi:hypothetical protein
MSNKHNISCYALIFLFILPCMKSRPDDSMYIYGIHSWGDGASGLMNGKGGWSVEVVNTDYFPWDFTLEQAQRLKNEGFTLILRINKYFGQTVPSSSSQFDSFAQAVSDKAWMFRNYTTRFIIGNEMNADFEGNIPVTSYETVFLKCRTKIKERLPQAEVIVGAVAPWNASQTGIGPYPSNRQWLNYFYQLVNDLGDNCDGYAIHAYGGRGGDADPRDDNEMGFGVFHKWLEIIVQNPYAASKPVYLTEMNHAADGESAPGFPLYSYPAGYISKLFEAVNTYNESHFFRVKAACWFSHANGGFPGYNISTNSQMADDFRWSTSNTDYMNRFLSASNWTWYE